ncbi:MAG: hypothetical protein RJA36_3958 [Pseudomonadota bacterium]|jgi:DUF4097 and DUF4098 domain-containing protein YvlB
MATYTKFLDYVEQLNKAVHNWSSHTIKAALTNTAPVNTNTVFANLTEISAGNGYSAGGMTLDTVTLSETSGTAKVTIADEVLTASGGSIGPLRYVSIYNDTPTSPADPLVAFYDYGSSITLAAGESFTVDFDATNGLWQLA